MQTLLRPIVALLLVCMGCAADDLPPQDARALVELLQQQGTLSVGTTDQNLPRFVTTVLYQTRDNRPELLFTAHTEITRESIRTLTYGASGAVYSYCNNNFILVMEELRPDSPVIAFRGQPEMVFFASAEGIRWNMRQTSERSKPYCRLDFASPFLANGRLRVTHDAKQNELKAVGDSIEVAAKLVTDKGIRDTTLSRVEVKSPSNELRFQFEMTRPASFPARWPAPDEVTRLFPSALIIKDDQPLRMQMHPSPFFGQDPRLRQRAEELGKLFHRPVVPSDRENPGSE